MIGNNQTNISNNSRDECINVVIRIRGKKNDENGKCTILNILDDKSVQIDNKVFYYDYVANMNSTQEEMFQHCAKRICDNSLKGYNGTIFAYGQTGSGKTFTLLGKNITKYSENKFKNNFSIDNTNMMDMNDFSQDNDIINLSMNTNTNTKNNTNNINKINITDNQNLYYYDINDQGIGLLPRIIYYLFQNGKKTENIEYKFKISYLEIYQETISDLLNPNNSRFVQLRDLGTSIVLDGLRKLIISSPEEAIRYVIQGNKLRHTASTLMNNESSRSHAVISIYIEKTISQETNKPKVKIQKSVFHIIDLAGSERQKKTQTVGERTREAGAINKSLLNLSIVITNIINNKNNIPYRDCKLTHLLKDSLGGNAKTSIIAAVSPFDDNKAETLSTLFFAQNAKKVKNHAIVNEVSANENIRDMKILKKYNSVVEENMRLKQELIKYQKDNNNLANFLNDMEGVDRGIDEFVKEMNNLQEKNAKLRDKVEKSELELKIRDKKIESLKEQINNYIQSYKSLMKEKNDFISKNIILTGQLKEEEEERIKLEKHYKEQIVIMEQNNNKTDIIINNKGMMIDDLKNRINDYINQIAIKDKQINELSITLEQKNNIINEINSQKINEKQKIEDLYKQINQLHLENDLKQKEIEELRKNNNEIKDKGKNLLKKYDENIDKNSDEILSLKNKIKESEKKLENAFKIYHNLEQNKLMVETELEKKIKNIDSYLMEIYDLNQKIRILNSKYESLKTEYDKIKLNLDNKEDNNNETHPRNIFSERNNQISKKNPIKRNNTKRNSKSPNNINIDNIKYKKYYEELKKKYDETLKNISGGKKIKNVQDLIEKINNIEKDLNECRRIMNSSFNKIQDILSKDLYASDLTNQPFDFNCNSFDSNIEQKFYVNFEKFIEFHMIRENQLKNMKEQNERLINNIQLNEEKKQIFEIENNNNEKSKTKLLSNIAYKSIAKNRKGNLLKDLSTNTKKTFDCYNYEIPEMKDVNSKDKNNISDMRNNIITENGIGIANYLHGNKNIKINSNSINLNINKSSNNNVIISALGKENNIIQNIGKQS